MKNVFAISAKGVQFLAEKKFGRKLNQNELERVKKGIEFGLECWEDVVINAIAELANLKNEI